MMANSIRHVPSALRVRLLFALVAALVLAGRGSGSADIQAQEAATGCAAAANPIACENALEGSVDWEIDGVGESTIQGFATDISVNRGQTIDFKINTAASNYTIDIYRIGYYSGAGARRISTVAPTTALPQTQPACATGPATGLIDCGTWAVSASWAVPNSAVSGVYLARLTRVDGIPGASHIVFIVRDDTRRADMLFQTSDPTWYAYNMYGGTSLYCGGPVSNAGTDYACPGRAVKVSYNRPLDTRATSPNNSFFASEYPMVRWLEANGYDVKYWAGIDTDRRGAELAGAMRPKVFLSVGHDEYWSGAQRAHVEAARNAGVNLGFFSGNEVYWKTRWENSIDGSGTPYRTLVTYKETLAGAKIDPAVDAAGTPIWTGTWRDPRFSPPADGGRPENALVGSIWTVSCCTAEITVPESFSKLRFWRNTRVAALGPGQVATLGQNTLGYEWGENLDNGFRPAGLMTLSSTTVTVPEKLVDFGSRVAPGTAAHSLTLYRHNTVDAIGNEVSSALVFGASTVQWSWGLDSNHDAGISVPDGAMQQATVNLFADMGVQPQTLQVGADPLNPLVPAASSTDTFAPSSTITAPMAGSPVQSGSRVTISGTAIDAQQQADQGRVAAVEVSVDGGATWQQARGQSPWTFEWVVGATGIANIRSRAIDDSGNVEPAGAGINVTVVAGRCPCTSLWDPNTTVPAVPEAADAAEINVGVRLHAATDGFIIGIRFYKGANNIGTHVGTLWTMAGTQLANVTFTSETASGWQEARFDAPVAIVANTTYVASYHTTAGRYAATSGYFAGSGVDSPPLHARTSGLVGGNGVFKYGAIALPNSSFNATNYWVDVIFAPTLDDTTAPTISTIKAVTVDGSKAIVTWTTNEASTSRIDLSTDAAIVSDLSNLPQGTVTATDGAFVTQHRLVLTGLAPHTTYYYRVASADRAGNRAVAPAPSFTLPGPTLRDSIVTDFSAGIVNGTYVSETGDGELILAPAAGSEFPGSALPSGWLSVPWGVSGGASVANGMLRVDGARAGTCVLSETGCVEQATLLPGRSFEFLATFTGDPFQHAGLALTLEAAPWAMFSTQGGGSLWARSLSTTGALQNNELGNSLLGTPHLFRIDWHADRVDFSIDGVLRVSQPVAIAGPMRPVVSDFNPSGGFVAVDWMRAGPYAAAGSFTSRAFDAGASVNWRSVNWASAAPAGTTLAISVRAGDVLDVDGSVIGDWMPVAATGAAFNVTSRYIQYRAQLQTAAASVTSELSDIIISTDSAPVAVDDTVTAVENATSTFPASGPGSLTFNDTDADTDALTVIAVTQPAHGTTRINEEDGSVSYTPAANFNGADSFVYTVSDGLLASSATVRLSVGPVNNAPVANGDLYGTNEDTPLVAGAAAGVLRNDTDAENDPLTAALVAPPLHGGVTLSADGSFTYVPFPDYAGSDVFSYRVTDGKTSSNVAQVFIDVAQVNDPPIATADTYSMLRNQTLSVAAPGVLSNDRDIEVEDANPLNVVQVVGSGPQHGTLTLALDGSFTYAPDADFVGHDSFAYRARDHFGALGNPAIVSIKVDMKAVTAQAAAGETVTTGVVADANDPVQGAVTSPAAAIVSISQGVIANSQPPAGYTFLNQQVNITALNPDGTEATGTIASPIVVKFVVDSSLVAPGENAATVQVFHNGALIGDCIGATSIPSADRDPCVSERLVAASGDLMFTVLTTHAGIWNMGVSTAIYGAAPFAREDGYTGIEGLPITVPAPGVLVNDFGRAALSAVLVEGPLSGNLAINSAGGFTFMPEAGFSGAVSFTYRASDGTLEGNTATATLVVTPVNRAPSFTRGADQNVLEDSGPRVVSGWATNISAGRTTEAGQGLQFSTSNDNPGLFMAAPAVSAEGTLTFTPTPNANGVANVTVSLRDDGGTQNGGADTSAPHTFVITVAPVNDPPRFIKGADQTVNENVGPQTVIGWATSMTAGPSDEAGQSLTFVIDSHDNPALLSSGPAVAANGTLSYTPAPNASGVAHVVLRLKDNGGTLNGGADTSAAETLTITVSAVNEAPVAVDDQASGDEDTAISGNVLANDTDGDADRLTAAVVSPPAHGTLTLNADGSFTYTPAAHYNGSDTFTYKANDGASDSNVATVSITVNAVNDAPVAAGQTVTTAEDIAKPIALTPTDVDGNPLTYTVVIGPAHGTLSGTAPALTYTPTANYSGPDSFTFKVNDGAVDSNVATVSISVTPVNDAPVATNDSYNADAGATLTVVAPGVLGNDRDQDGDSLTAVLVATATKGSLTLNANGSFTYAPQANATGSDTFTYKVKDATLESAAATVTIAIKAASAPLTLGPITWNVSVDPVKVATPITGTASATGVQTATWNWGDGTTSSGTISGTSVTGARTYAAAGIYTVRLTVADQNGASAQSVYQYVVVNNPAAGYLQGGGPINSPAGSYTANPALAGSATLSSIVAKHAADGTMNTANNVFRFAYTPALLDFTGSKMYWLVISGNKAWLKGEGSNKINGVTEQCYFLMALTDSMTTADRVRVKIWSKATGRVIYDNQKDVTGTSPPDDTAAVTGSPSSATVLILK